MARFPLIVQSERRKRIGLALTVWLKICTVASWFLVTLGTIHSLHTYRPRIRSYILDFYAKRVYVKILVYARGIKSSSNMLVDEKVAMF
ncbi:hypothetical protein Gotur_009976 [Gossypium turneri]